MRYKDKFTKERIVMCVVLFLIAKYYLGLTAQFIPLTGDWGVRAGFNLQNDNLLIIQHIVVVNPPRNFITREIIIRGYDWMYPIPESHIQEAVDRLKVKYKQKGKNIDEMRVVEYVRSFYKESDDTPENWDGSPDYSKEGPEYSHRQDLIADIQWKDGEWKESTLYGPKRFSY